ncbi:hypothetical protein [Pseudorhodobacter aquimaris]|uniref:hypothetical protein n=1 Tax=Pseudorhodobacter aquimaris TaxID=687412 RepID=UPI0012ED25DC|nr:hypothetical protein [Pseudorhodobacter aquimaris]
MLATLLERKIDTLLATHPSVARGQVEKICESLSTLRPRVPIDVVAKMADGSERREALIRKNPDIAGLALNSEQIEEIAC